MYVCFSMGFMFYNTSNPFFLPKIYNHTSSSFRVNEVHNYIQADALELSTEYLLDPRTIQ